MDSQEIIIHNKMVRQLLQPFFIFLFEVFSSPQESLLGNRIEIINGTQIKGGIIMITPDAD